MPFMKLAHQVAQKLHGLTESESERVHDLIDLQVIMREEPPALETVKPLCIRLFSYRDMQPWPPVIEIQPGWAEGYKAASEGLAVLDLEEAITWGNDLIDRIDSTELLLGSNPSHLSDHDIS